MTAKVTNEMIEILKAELREKYDEDNIAMLGMMLWVTGASPSWEAGQADARLIADVNAALRGEPAA